MRDIKFSDPQIIVYQMGKVASRAIVDTLESQTEYKNIIHIHHMSYAELDRIERWYNYELGQNTPDYIDWSRAVRRRVEEFKGTGKLKIITLFRDPVEVEISAMFQNIDVSHRECLNNDDTLSENKILNKINKVYSEYNVRDSYYLNWFERELNDVFDFDIYSYDSKVLHQQGYNIINLTCADILVINYHSLRNVFNVAIEKFLGVKNITLIHSNVSSEKKYAKEYRQVKDMFNLPIESREKIYSSKYAKYFFPTG